MKPVFFVLLIITIINCSNYSPQYPDTAKIPVITNYHGIEIIDNYQWLEDIRDEKVQDWLDAQQLLTKSHLKNIQQIEWLEERFDHLWRIDDISLPIRVHYGERIFWTESRHDKDASIWWTRACDASPEKLLLDPNTWDYAETLEYVVPSRDGRYIAFGRARGGNEAPVLYVMDTETGEVLPDRVKGWRQYISDWLPDGSGFYYTANPLPGEVPEGEEYYWSAVHLHILGTPKEQDMKVWYSDNIKKAWHSVRFSEDASWEIFHRGVFHSNEVFIRPAGKTTKPVPIVEGFESRYRIMVYDDKLYIMTNHEAPNWMVYTAPANDPVRENWKVFITEEEKVLTSFTGINGKLYANYMHMGHTQIKAYNTAGNFIRDISLPSIGTAYISGWWSKEETRLYFNSFAFPSTVYSYDIEKDELIVIKEYPGEYDIRNIRTRLVDIESKDGTIVPMFLIYNESIDLNGNNPVILSGYGGFNISVRPRFSSLYYVFLEAGAIIALPMLRGGGEFGRLWHEAGMLENKQNTFDDFIASAEWLIKNKYTRPERLAIQGGSNGGLLVGAVTVQRPDLFRAVLCQVPLLDMLRYHKFDFAGIWAREYGSSDDPEQFNYIVKYSPYHNIKEGIKSPAILFTASEFDARTAPFHAMKMTAAMQRANTSEHPVLLLLHWDSGHGGGTTLSKKITQTAKEWGFLLHQIGIEVPNKKINE